MYKKRLKKWNLRKRSYRQTASLAASHKEDADEEQVPRGRVPAAHVAVDRTARIEPYAGLELVLDSVAAWSLNKLDSSHMQTDPMSRYLACPNSPPIQDSRTMYRTFELVFDLWYYGKGQLAGMAARKAFYALEFVLTEDHPDLVWHVLDAIYDMVDRGHIQLLALFLAHADALARRLLAANHPLLKILQQLSKCDHQTEQGRHQICHLLRLAWLRNVHILSQYIGSPAPQHLWLYEQLIWDGRVRLRQGSGLAQKRETITAALHKLSQQQLTVDDEHEKLRIDALVLEYTQMDLGDLQRAEELATGLLSRTASDAGARSNARFHAYARKMLARLQQEKRDWARAEENFRRAISKREAAHGAESNLRVIRDVWVLAAHFQRAGRQEAAAQMAEDATARAERYLQADPAGCIGQE